MTEQTHPNLIYVFADQLRYHSCGYAGDAKARTPNMDRLASESISLETPDLLRYPDKYLRQDGTSVFTRPGEHRHTHLDLRYLIHGGTADPDPPEGESQQIGWFTWDAAIDRADPGLRGILEFLRS